MLFIFMGYTFIYINIYIDFQKKHLTLYPSQVNIL